MQNFLVNKIEFSDIISNFYGEFLFWLIAVIFGAIWAQNKKILLPLIYRYFGRIVFNIIRWLLYVLTSLYLRFGIIALLLLLININYGNTIFLSILIFIFCISTLWSLKRNIFFNPAGKFSDSFDDENALSQSWEIKTGGPVLDKNFGKPAPDLELKKIRGEATNSFVWLKNIKSRSGIIECDFNIEQNGLFNIVFYADKENDNWYMARYDSRQGFSDGFIIKDKGPGNNWRTFILSGTLTEAKRWFRARIEFSEKIVKMYKDGELISQFELPKIFGENIGIFNEVNDVHVDNFIFIESV